MENLDATIVTTAVPVMSASLGVPPLSLKAVLTSYTLSLAGFIPVSGWMADRYGTRRVFLAAIVLFMSGSIFCGLSWTIPLLVASRVLQGLGGAMMVPVGRLTLVRSFPRSDMVTMLNYVAIPALIGPLIGPFLGGVIVHWLHWRVIFLMNIPFSVAGILLASRFMPDYREPDVPRFDLVGFLLLGTGVTLVSYVLEVFGEHQLSSQALLILLGIAAALLTAYGVHACRVRNPLLSLALFKVRTFRVAVAGGFVTRLGVGGMPFLLPLLYQIGLGYPAWQAGLLTMPQAAAAILMRGLNRPILRYLGHRKTLVLNTLLLGGSMAGFLRIAPGVSPVTLMVLGFILGFLSSLQFTGINTLVFADLDDREVSRAGSISSATQQLSLSFGVATASLAVSAFLGHAPVVSAIHKAILVLAGLTLVSSAWFAALRRTDGANISRFSGAGE